VHNQGCWGEIGGNLLKKIPHETEKSLTFHSPAPLSEKEVFMARLGLRYYFLDGNEIIRVGLDTKKLFPKLAGKQVIWITITFHKDTMKLAAIRIDPANINQAGEWTSDIEDRYAAQVLGEALSGRSGKVISLRPYLSRIKLSDSQREILRNRIDVDFGAGTWGSIPPKNRALLWSTGRTSE
jgi:hypothetical protein